MSSNAFNLSTLVAMREQRVEQTSVHFWRCRLTKENPRLAWNPDAEPAAKKDPDEPASGEAGEDLDDGNADSATRHLLHVTGCVLAPEAAGIHLVTVRTRGYQPKKLAGAEQPPADEPEPCPILCVDPAVQRTLALGHEFVLDSSTTEHQQEDQQKVACVFELAEGSGPVWLTGTHRVHRVIDSGPAACCEDDEEEEEEEDVAAADVSEDIGEESDEDEEEEEDVEEEDDDDEELIEEVKPAAKKKQKPPQKQKKVAVAPPPQQKRRKRAKPDS